MQSITHTTSESTLKKLEQVTVLWSWKKIFVIGFRNVRLHRNPLFKKKNEKKSEEKKKEKQIIPAVAYKN